MRKTRCRWGTRKPISPVMEGENRAVFVYHRWISYHYWERLFGPQRFYSSSARSGENFTVEGLADGEVLHCGNSTTASGMLNLRGKRSRAYVLSRRHPHE